MTAVIPGREQALCAAVLLSAAAFLLCISALLKRKTKRPGPDDPLLCIMLFPACGILTFAASGFSPAAPIALVLGIMSPIFAAAAIVLPPVFAVIAKKAPPSPSEKILLSAAYILNAAVIFIFWLEIWKGLFFYIFNPYAY